MKPYTIHQGSNMDILPILPDNSVDSIVTDPPYELGFMGKEWDSTGIAYNVEMWRQCLRVLKPGGHLVAFSGSRTYHRMAVAIENAGFQIRDQMMWVYGSGFPKSHNISKALDKLAGEKRKVIGQKEPCGMFSPDVPHFGSASDVIETYKSSPITAPATDEAKQWDGWGTALKPAHEPIVLARKPLEGTVAENVLKWGVGGLNIDACRVGERFPANLMHDGSQEVLELFPESKSPKPYIQKTKSVGMFGAEVYHDRKSSHHGDSGSAARFFYCPKANKKDRDEGCEDFEETRESDRPSDDKVGGDNPRNRSNTYRKNSHPTVKPTELMRYLCCLVTPANGTVLDPFNGSGSTGKGAVLEGFKYIGIEISEDYINISKARIDKIIKQK